MPQIFARFSLSCLIVSGQAFSFAPSVRNAIFKVLGRLDYRDERMVEADIPGRLAPFTQNDNDMEMIVERPHPTTRLYTGEDGQSHLEQGLLSMDQFEDKEGAHGLATPWMACDRFTIRQMPQGYDHGWHNAPRRQYVFLGSLEIEVGSGETLTAGPGDILLAEDETGRGHCTRNVGDGPCWYAVLVLEDEQFLESSNAIFANKAVRNQQIPSSGTLRM